jgi:surface protein
MKEIINELIDKKQQLKEEIERKGVDMSTATFSDYGDKIREIGDGSLYVSPLAQLGYSKEDEEFYSDLDFGTLGEMIEDFEYSRGKMGATTFRDDTTIKYAPYIDFGNTATNIQCFNNCTNLVSVPLGLRFEKCTDLQYFFANCKYLKSVSLSNWYIPKVKSFHRMFLNCSRLEVCDVSELDMSNITNVSSMFESVGKLKRLETSNWNTSNIENFGNFTNWCSKLEYVDVSNWNTGKATKMYGIFRGASSLTELEVGNWNTSSAIDMSYMFQNCSSLTSLDVSNWNTSNVTTMSNMFNGCNSLKKLDVSGFDTSNVTSFGAMFSYCYVLEDIDASKWNTEKCRNISTTFRECRNITRLDLSGWKILECQDYTNTFNGCSSLEYLDMSGVEFGTATQNNMTSFLYGCKKIDVLKLKNLGAAASVNFTNAFSQCESLGSSDEGLKALKETFVNSLFDRASAGYSASALQFHKNVKDRLTDEEKAKITAKGFTII